MHIWKTVILTLLIFGLGSVAGGLVTSRILHARIQKDGLVKTPSSTPAPPPLEAEWNAAQIEVMQRQVNLPPGQRRQVVDIFGKAQVQVQSMREDWKSRIREILQQADRTVLELLSPEQRVKFEGFRQKRHQFWQRRQQGGPVRERIQQFRENAPAP